MQRGSEVHKILEEQVHTTVPVDVQTKEDTWGLKIWNVIQGLRTLRVTGMTRELEIWGVIDGQIVNGIVDELSYTCTDPELEDTMNRWEKQSKKELPPDQTTIGQFFGGNTLERRVATLESKVGLLQADVDVLKEPHAGKKIYLTDVKTRASPKLPNAIAMRGTHMQLSIYRELLASMASNAVDASTVFERYKLSPTRPFSDGLIAQLANLDFNFEGSQEDSQEAMMSSEADTVSTLLAHNSLRLLWELMILEFQMTMPTGGASISKVLKVEFRSSKDGGIVGVKTFPFRDEVLDGYIKDVMSWWRGKRAAKGVEVEEAFKCGTCEFAESCEWRKSRVELAVKSSRAARAKYTPAKKAS